MTPVTDDELDRWSHAIAADGAAAHEAEIAALAQVAAGAGASPVVLGVLADRAAPDVVRARAWCHAADAVRRCRTNPEVALVA
jgi:hypothetical protein